MLKHRKEHIPLNLLKNYGFIDFLGRSYFDYFLFLIVVFRGLVKLEGVESEEVYNFTIILS